MDGKELSRLPSTSKQMAKTILRKQRPSYRVMLMVSGLFLQGSLKTYGFKKLSNKGMMFLAHPLRRERDGGSW